MLMTNSKTATTVHGEGHQVRSGAVRFLRELDACEEYFWLRQQSLLVQHVAAVQVCGRVAPETWQEAWQGLHNRYAMLSACILKESGKRPSFHSTSSFSVLTMKPWSPDLKLDDEVAAELNNSLGDGSTGLMRLTVFHGAEEAIVLLTAHHSAADGKTNLLILEDLLTAVTGPSQKDVVPWLPLSALLHQPGPVPYAKTLTPEAYRDANTPPPECPSLKVSHLTLTAPQTLALREHARRERTTVHGALVAASTFALASCVPQRENSPTQAEAAIRCVSPVDQRVLTGASSASGTPLTFPALAVPYRTEPSLWALARRVNDKLKVHRTRDGALEAFNALRQMCATEVTPAQLEATLASAPVAPGLLTPGFMVTNGGASKLQTEYAGLRVLALMTAVNSGGPAMQTLSVNTIGGVLGMTHISRLPVADLLEDARDYLLKA